MSITKILLKEFNNPSFIEKVKNSPNFKRWFGDSKVMDDEGNPLVVFHATHSDFTEFKKGDIGFHFGTDKSARERISKRMRMSSEKGYRKTGAFFLAIENPLYSHDAESWDVPTDVVEALAIALDKNGFIKDEEEYYQKWIKYINKASDLDSSTSKDDMLNTIKTDLINEYNIDGIIYENDFEDVGSQSYIAFLPEQIKSIFNDGSFDKSDKNFMS